MEIEYSHGISKRISFVRNILSQNKNPKVALEQRAYMKNKFHFFGIKSPERENLMRGFYKFKRDKDELLDEVEQLWNLSERDFQYIALKLLERNRKMLNHQDILFVENLIINKSWWDTVDLLSSNIMGHIIKDDFQLQNSFSKKWIESGNLWLQRCSIIFQLKYKDKTNLLLLENNILELNSGKEFFINKAIGWALRQYAKTDAKWVESFVFNNNLSNLSSREALKNIKKD